MVAGKYSLKEEYGLPYAIRLGPYGVVLALVWDRDDSGSTHLVALSTRPSHIENAWKLEGLDAPHDMEIVPAPLAVTAAGERLLSVLVAETAPSGSTVKKFVISPDGHVLAKHDGDMDGGDAPVKHSDDPPPDGLAASHIGHAALKPVDDDAATGAGIAAAAEHAREEETEAALVVGREGEPVNYKDYDELEVEVRFSSVSRSGDQPGFLFRPSKIHHPHPVPDGKS